MNFHRGTAFLFVSLLCSVHLAGLEGEIVDEGCTCCRIRRAFCSPSLFLPWNSDWNVCRVGASLGEGIKAKGLNLAASRAGSS